MNWMIGITGLAGAAMFVLGAELALPLGSSVAGLLALAGVVSTMVFLGLAEGE